ncbi:MAG: adenylate/guanylate cyclase domain-containing protein [Gammaproteobacteria bacterium]|nr:MAG: adenylate/guanylate cyclase domain-containing protein [Gammaproteobacteria bacterium]
MSAQLKYKNGKIDQTIECSSVLTIGRDKNSDIVLKDLMVSRNHAMIRLIGGGDYYLIDSGSSNGSYINKKRVAMPTLLKNGDRVTIGHVVFTFTYQQADSIEKSDTLSLQDTIVVDSPDIKQNTILVADIRGFTSLSEQVDIKTLTRMMNKWFHNVSNAIFTNGGTVDKFIGDCVFARWETENEDNQDASIVPALRSAWLINIITDKLNSSFPEVNEKIRIGVGVNTGAASVGIGQDNTALGDAVNIAFRLENASKMLDTDVVLSEAAYQHLPSMYWRGKEQHIRVKGKRDSIRILSLKFDEVESLLQSLNKANS